MFLGFLLVDVCALITAEVTAVKEKAEYHDVAFRLARVRQLTNSKSDLQENLT